eukprot:jgi/Picre1/35422/NNA_002884.t1
MKKKRKRRGEEEEELEDDEAILSRPRYPNVIRIFCREFLNSSKGMYYRKFNACSVAAAWKVHLENDPAKLHWKRLREGFSLEFPDTNVYELDSSSEAKFSRHLIVRIENHAFYNNIAVGDFVAQVLAESGTSLFVKDKNKKDTYFVDTAVYTKNRHFRLVYSCKGGRKASLMPTHRFAMARQPLPTPAQIFKETMVTGKAGVGTSNIRIDRGMVKKDAKDMLPDAAAMKKLQSIANAAIPFIEQFGAKRAGRPTTVRTVQICGGNGRVAYSMLGDVFDIPTKFAWNPE